MHKNGSCRLALENAERAKAFEERRLAKIIDPDYCGHLTVREFAWAVANDHLNFPKGLDTPLSIGDFEGNFWTDMLSFTTGGEKSDHVCIMGGI